MFKNVKDWEISSQVPLMEKVQRLNFNNNIPIGYENKNK